MNDRRKSGCGHELPPPMSAKQLRTYLAYDRDSGLLYWRQSRRGVTVGQIAGCRQSMGYVVLMIDGARYQAHRLIWFMVTDDWLMVDHKDGDGFNNRWDNLRPATKQQNGWNQSHRGISGYKGVYATASGKWAAQIWKDGKHVHYPSRDTPGEAYADYCAAALKHHGQFARLS